MSPIVEFATQVLSAFTVAGDISAVGIILLLAVRKAEYLSSLARHAALFSFVIALGSTAASLFYSQVAGFAPCPLCWWQRIFLYPQVIMLGIALWKKERIADYAIALSSIGAAIAAYHTYLQFGGSPLIPCSASGAAVSCAQRYFLMFGYVTIPTMSLTAFVLIILLMVAQKINP